MKPRTPQLSLRLDAAAPDPEARWRAGSSIAYLGAPLVLVLDSGCRLPERVGGELHLPLPPAATPRQIRDAAESWLRDEAQRIFTEKCRLRRPTSQTTQDGNLPADAGALSALAGRQAPRIVLGFGKRGDWTQREGDVLRCHWRLVEQPLAVIEQVLARAQAETNVPACDDLFAALAG